MLWVVGGKVVVVLGGVGVVGGRGCVLLFVGGFEEVWGVVLGSWGWFCIYNVGEVGVFRVCYGGGEVGLGDWGFGGVGVGVWEGERLGLGFGLRWW